MGQLPAVWETLSIRIDDSITDATMPTIWPVLKTALHAHDAPPPANWSRCYETKYAVARLVQPKTIFEIGVRAGYSALAFLRAVPVARYLGIDANSNSHGGFQGSIEHARKLLASYDAEIRELSSAAYAEMMNHQLPPQFDLIHIDGDHSFSGCLHDLFLAHRLQYRHLLIDDYRGIGDVKLACDSYLRIQRGDLTQLIIQDGHNDAILLSRPP